MDVIHVSYADLKTKSFQDFFEALKLQHTTSIDHIKPESSDPLQKCINLFLKYGCNGIYSYFAVLDSIHHIVQKGLYKIQHMQDENLIRALIAHTSQFGSIYFEERMKQGIVLLLALQGSSYYVLAYNDCEHVDDAFHAESYKNLGKGILDGIRHRSLFIGVDTAWRAKWKERFRRRAVAVQQINLLLLLYLYGCYLACQNIEYIYHTLEWLIASGYKWLYLPNEFEYDILNRFLLMLVPDVGLGLPKDTRMLNFFSEIEKYQAIMLLQYRQAPSEIQDAIRQAKNLAPKFQNYINDLPFLQELQNHEI